MLLNSTSLLGILMLVLFGLGIFHFIYEGVIAPSLRKLIQYKLFELRDSLRLLRYEGSDSCSKDVFVVLQESLNNSINLTKIATWHLIRKMRDLIAEDQHVRSEVERRRQILKSCQHPTIKHIRDRQFDLLIWAVLINNGGLLFYVWLLLPLMAIIWAITRWRRGIKGTLRQIESIIDLPEGEYKRENYEDARQPVPV